MFLNLFFVPLSIDIPGNFRDTMAEILQQMKGACDSGVDVARSIKNWAKTLSSRIDRLSSCVKALVTVGAITKVPALRAAGYAYHLSQNGLVWMEYIEGSIPVFLSASQISLFAF